MIHIISTGGTIEGLEYDDPNKKGVSNGISIQDLLQISGNEEKYCLDKILDKDSRFINQEDRITIANTITSSTHSKILLTHGTITMVETAKYLGSLELDKTIILTGAFILGTQPNTDAPDNLKFAIASFENLNSGVYIAMNNTVLPWYNAKKNVSKNRFEPL
ncbi:asparaginase domain-containing protein [Aquimarina spongiae]|uniref:Asparaginase n=1 Tax=Aquimarina spongiae TaxID=570521 RepID=A0A1M6HBQ9_9FLAO|nr:asparaginase domain-containing protein [Aquimarina spongiae]SHJ19640.1 asparaginase [Aquimarina spongiae]